MSTSKAEIAAWFDEGVRKGATHMLVVCDTYDWEDYPIYVMPNESARLKYEEYLKGQHSMQKVMEVYSLKRDKDEQLNRGSVFNFDDDQLTLEQAENELQKAVYEATAILEKLERAGQVSGNGHHARQKLAQMAVEELRSRWVAKV